MGRFAGWLSFHTDFLVQAQLQTDARLDLTF